MIDRILDAIGWPATWGRAWPAGALRAAAILALAAVASVVLVRLLARVVRQIAARTRTDLDDRILALTERPARRLVIAAGLYYAVETLPLGPLAHQVATGVVYVAAVFLFTRVVLRVVLVLVAAYGRRRMTDRPAQFEKDYLPLLSKVLGTVLVTIGLISVLHHFGQNVSSLVAALGVGGIAVGLAAKETLGNMFAGFTILTDRPFRPGDRIKLGSGEIGDVLEIGMRSTRLALLDGNMLIAPNAELVNSRVVNFNYPDHTMRGRFDVGVVYGSDVDRVKRIVREVILAQPEVLPAPAPVVLLAGLGERALQVTASYVVADFSAAGAVEERIRLGVLERFAREGVKLPQLAAA